MKSKKVIMNVVSTLVLQIVVIICGFITPRLIIKTFGSNINGMMASITQFLSYITLLESGMGPVVKSVLYKPIAKKNKKNIEKILKSAENFFRIIALIFVIYIIFLCCVLPFILENDFNKLFIISMVIIISISTFAEYFFGITYRLYLQAEQKTYIVSIIQICTTILNTIMIVILILYGAKIQVVKLISSIIFIMVPVMQNAYVKRKYNINLKKVKTNYKIKQKWDGLAQHIASVIHNNTDVVILTIFLNSFEVSVYSVYFMVINGVKKIVQSFTGGIDATLGDMIAKNERRKLNEEFIKYESVYFLLTTIIFSSTLILIVPFIKIYTLGIYDVNYNRPIFAFVIVLAELLWAIRLPYNSLTLAAGHFKQTKKGAWVESFVNIILSVCFVFKFGIIGVAFATFIAMFIRTIEFMYYSSKYILERNIWLVFKRLFMVFIEIFVILLILKYIPYLNINNYLDWVIYALIVVTISSFVVLIGNLLVFKKEINNIFRLIKNIFRRKVVFK